MTKQLRSRTRQMQATRLARIANRGPAHARFYFKRDGAGQFTVMMLAHYQDSPSRPPTGEEYIGVKPDRQIAALRRLLAWEKSQLGIK